VRDAAKEPLATVYQKHNSVLSRKALYTGWRLSGAGTLTVEVVGSNIHCQRPKRRWTTAVTINN